MRFIDCEKGLLPVWGVECRRFQQRFAVDRVVLDEVVVVVDVDGCRCISVTAFILCPKCHTALFLFQGIFTGLLTLGFVDFEVYQRLASLEIAHRVLTSLDAAQRERGAIGDSHAMAGGLRGIHVPGDQAQRFEDLEQEMSKLHVDGGVSCGP